MGIWAKNDRVGGPKILGPKKCSDWKSATGDRAEEDQEEGEEKGTDKGQTPRQRKHGTKGWPYTTNRLSVTMFNTINTKNRSPAEPHNPLSILT